MEISVQSGDVIEALSRRLGETIVELETSRLALDQAQELILALERQVIEKYTKGTSVHSSQSDAERPGTESHPVL